MVRDEFKDKIYFNTNIEELIIYIKEDVEEIKLNKIKKSQKDVVSRGNFGFSMDVIFSMYSRGDSKADIKIYFTETVTRLSDKENNWKSYWEGFLSPYDIKNLLIMLSLAILLDASKEEVRIIVDTIEIVPKRYKILDYYISFFDSKRIISKEDSSEVAFKDLNKMIELSNEEIVNKKYMDKYLKTWFKKRDRVYKHDTHNNGGDNYVGYWSFESAAFAKIRGLDDSSFRDNVYYPKDMLQRIKNV